MILPSRYRKSDVPPFTDGFIFHRGMMGSSGRGFGGQPAQSIYKDAILADLPIAYWRLGESSGAVAVDEVGSYDGDYYNSPVLGNAGAIVGDSDSSVLFNGTDQYIGGLGGYPDFSFVQNTGVFTIEAWIKLSDPTALISCSVAGSTATSVEKGFYCSWDNRDGVAQAQLRMAIQKGDGTPVVSAYSSVDAITDTNYHHVVFRGDGSNVSFFVDGVRAGNDTPIGTLSTGDSTRGLNIARNNYSTPSGYFNGALDEVAVYNRALTDLEIADHYRKGKAISTYADVVAPLNPVAYWRLGEASGTTATDEVGAHDGTYTGTFTLGVSGATFDSDTAVSFDGTSHVEVPHSTELDNTTSGFSVSVWVAPNSSDLTVDTPAHVIVQKGPINDGFGLFMLYGGELTARFFHDGTGQDITFDASTWTAGEWHHIGVVHDTDDTAYLYIDGVLAGSRASTSRENNTGAFYIGDESGGGNDWVGAMDECAVFDSPLTAESIADLYNGA